MKNIRIKTKYDTITQLVRPRPIHSEAFETFVSEIDDFRAYIHLEVIRFIKEQAKRYDPCEAVGLVAGRICQDPVAGPYTLVMAADGAGEGECESASSIVKLSPQGHAKVRRRLEDSHPDREIIGWYHTHPHNVARFSCVDNKEQSTWSNPYHIGIVYSSIDSDEPFGVYRGPGSVLLRPLRSVY
jgi:proteasome lid subunit RPN8/RPN11